MYDERESALATITITIVTMRQRQDEAATLIVSTSTIEFFSYMRVFYSCGSD
jgi:hypothetical protein